MQTLCPYVSWGCPSPSGSESVSLCPCWSLISGPRSQDLGSAGPGREGARDYARHSCPPAAKFPMRCWRSPAKGNVTFT